MCFRPASASAGKTCSECGTATAFLDVVCVKCGAELPSPDGPGVPDVMGAPGTLGAPMAPRAPGVSPAAPGIPGAPASPKPRA